MRRRWANLATLAFGARAPSRMAPCCPMLLKFLEAAPWGRGDSRIPAPESSSPALLT